MTMKATYYCILVALGLTPVTSSATIFPSEPSQITLTSSSSLKLPLANTYQEGMELKDYWYSEKLDGIRSYWDGQRLYTRQGKPIAAPAWFLASFPSQALDGELWAGRGQFHHVQSTVLDTTPNEAAWKRIQFMAFDLPEHTQGYEARYLSLTQVIEAQNSPYLHLVKHYPISSFSDLQKTLKQIEALQGEGLILRHKQAYFRSGRSDDMLKFKSYQDDEAIVIGYKKGQGKYHNKIGSLLVKWKEGKVFYLGSGLTDALRDNPPAIGSQVTFRFNGLTHHGLPRFARFVRIRED